MTKQGPITLTFCGQQTTLRPWDPSTCGGISGGKVQWVCRMVFPDRAGKERSSDFIMFIDPVYNVEIIDFRSEDEELFLYTYIPQRADSACWCCTVPGEMNGATTRLPTTV